MIIPKEELEDIFYIHYAHKIQVFFESLMKECQYSHNGILKKNSNKIIYEFTELIKESIDINKLYLDKKKY